MRVKDQPDANGWYDINHVEPYLYQSCLFWNGSFIQEGEYEPKEYEDGFYLFGKKISHWKPLGLPPVGDGNK